MATGPNGSLRRWTELGLADRGADPPGPGRLEAACVRAPWVSGIGLFKSPIETLEMRILELQATRAMGSHFVLAAHPPLSGRPGQ
jgi:hypothetical protein